MIWQRGGYVNPPPKASVSPPAPERRRWAGDVHRDPAVDARQLGGGGKQMEDDLATRKQAPQTALPAPEHDG